MSETSVVSPEGWQVVKLKEVADVRAGYGFPKRLQGKTEGDFPFFKVGDISAAWQENQPVLGRAEHYLAEPQLQEIGARSFPPGATVFAKIGAAIALNRRAMLREQSLVDNNVMALIPNERVEDKYLFYFTWTLKLEELSRATTVPSIRKSDVQEIEIPLPPIGTQKRVVADLERHLTTLEQGERQLNRTMTNLDRYRASVLQAACEGRLVPTEAELARRESRDYEPADELLDRILAERRARWEAEELEKLKAQGKEPKDGRWKEKYEEPEGPDTRELAELPEGWVWVSMKQIAEVIGGLTKNRKRDALGSQVPYLRVANVYANELILDEVKTIGVKESELDRVLLEDRDLLIVEGNGSLDQIGRVAMWDGSIEPCAHQNHLIKARLVEKEMAEFVLYWLLSKPGRLHITKVASSTSGLYTLSLTKVSKLPVPLPPLPEQQRIVDAIDTEITLADGANREVETASLRADRLRKSVLRRAFKGQLTTSVPGSPVQTEA